MIFKGNGIVWDKDKNKPLISFGKEKEVDVYDNYIKDKLLDLGYKPEQEFIDVEYEEVKEEIEKIPDDNNLDLLSDAEIREMGKEYQIRSFHNMGIEKLKNKLLEVIQ